MSAPSSAFNARFRNTSQEWKSEIQIEGREEMIHTLVPAMLLSVQSFLLSNPVEQPPRCRPARGSEAMSRPHRRRRRQLQ